MGCVTREGRPSFLLNWFLLVQSPPQKKTPLPGLTPGGIMPTKRPDQNGTHRLAFERNKKKIYATQDCCGICGKPVDFSLKYPHPMSPCIDHIIPVARGGHPSDLDNLQLAHWTCNRQKSDKIFKKEKKGSVEATVTNRDLPQSMDWTKYKSMGA